MDDRNIDVDMDMAMEMDDAVGRASFLSGNYAQLRAAVRARSDATLPPPDAIAAAAASLSRHTGSGSGHGEEAPSTGMGPAATLSHILRDIVPALNGQAASARYFGFVTGGCHPAAEAADNVVTALDQNPAAHLPLQTAATVVEDAALRMLLALLGLISTSTSTSTCDSDWPGRVFTTGATASNVLGLACGREAVVQRRLDRVFPPQTPAEDDGRGQVEVKKTTTVAEMGLIAACAAAGVQSIQVLTSMAHSSLYKAASVVGLGRAAVRDLGVPGEPWRLDLDAVEQALREGAEQGEGGGVATIIAVSAGEVNTGRFATRALDMPKLRSLADRYDAWIHVDGAFGLFARALPDEDEFLHLHAYTAGLELADSITLDGHKLLNVPYDTGIFFCRDAAIQTQVFVNANAAYLSTPSSSDAQDQNQNQNQILSPFDIGIENSRRFRALPVYAVLLSEGRAGIAAMLARMVRLARGVAAFVRDSDAYEWLPSADASLESTHVIVLFRARDPALNAVLVDRINETRRMYVTGTEWQGRPACRIAVSSWMVDVERDLAVVKEVLTSAVES